MLPDLTARLGALRDARTHWLDALNQADTAEHTFREAPDAWHWLDVTQHLAATEHLTARLAERILRRPTPVPADAADRAARLTQALSTPRRFRVPGNARGVHPDGASLDAVRAQWEDAQAQWHELAAGLDDEGATHAVMQHPLAGPLNMAQTLDFFAVHIAHHEHQVARLREAYRQAGNAAPPPASNA